jgi:hypothetical protein
MNGPLLLQDLEKVLGTKFQSRSIPAALRQRIWSFLHNLTLPADQTVVQKLPYEPDPDLSLPQHSGFLFKPPVPLGAEGRKRSSNSSEAQKRNFNSYKSNKPFPVNGSSGSDGMHLYCVTCPAHTPAQPALQQQHPAGQQEQEEQQEGPAGQQQRQVATYRGYVRMFVGEQKPEDANGHIWQKVRPIRCCLKSAKGHYYDFVVLLLYCHFFSCIGHEHPKHMSAVTVAGLRIQSYSMSGTAAAVTFTVSMLVLPFTNVCILALLFTMSACWFCCGCNTYCAGACTG